MRWLAAALVAVALSELACGAPGKQRTSRFSAAIDRWSTSVAAAPTTIPTTTTTVDPGTLPQTHALPNAADPSFAGRIENLWQAIVTGDASLGLPAFFPESAYLQTKSGSNNTADWRYRLVSEYALDIQAAHLLLGPDSAGAEAVNVTVPTTRAVWTIPGQEQNKGPYYRVYGTRLTYWVDGKTKSFGIYSMLSWRGQWYVVHLGPNPRPAGRGVVYQPAG